MKKLSFIKTKFSTAILLSGSLLFFITGALFAQETGFAWQQIENEALILQRKMQNILRAAELQEKQLLAESKKQKQTAEGASKLKAEQAHVQKELALKKERVKELEKELQSFTERAKQKQNISEQLQAARETRRQTELQIAETTALRTQQAKGLHDAKQRLKDLERRCQKAQEQLRGEGKIASELRQEQKKHEKALRDWEGLVAAVESLEREKLQLERRSVEVQAELDGQQRRLNALQKTQKQVADLRGKTKELQGNSKVLTEKSEALAKQKRLLEKQLLEVAKKQAVLREQVVALEKSQGQKADLANQTAKLEEEVASQTAHLSDQTRQNQELQHKLHDSRQTINELEQKLKETKSLEKDLKKAQAHRQSVKKQQAATAGKWGRQRQAAVLLHSEAAKLSDQVDSLTAKLQVQTDLSEKIKQLKAQNMAVEAGLKSAAENQELTQETLRQLRQQLDLLQLVLVEFNKAAPPSVVAPVKSMLAPAAQATGSKLSLEDEEALLLAEARSKSLPQTAPVAATLPPEAPSDKAEAFYQTGVQAWDAGNVEGAIKAFKAAVSHRHNFAEAHYNLGIALARQGHKQESCRAAYEAGLLYLRQNSRQKALNALFFIQGVDPESAFAGKLHEAVKAAPN